MDLSDTPPPLPPFDWRNVYADPTVAFFEARRQNALRDFVRLCLALRGPFTSEMYARTLAENLEYGCVLFDDAGEVAKAETQVMRALAPYLDPSRESGRE